jgi:hypothetical protein
MTPPAFRPTLLADRLLLVATDDRTGKLLGSPNVLGLALAGSLLVELLVDRSVALDPNDMPVVHTQWDPVRTRASFHHDILATMCGERRRLDLETWVAFLASTALEWTYDRLVRAGLLHRERRGYRPVSSADAAEPRVALTNKVSRHEHLNCLDLALLALVLHSGLHETVLWQSPGRDGPFVDSEIHRLHMDPWLRPLRAVVGAVDSKISRRAFAH